MKQTMKILPFDIKWSMSVTFNPPENKDNPRPIQVKIKI
jgi:hypothetical protein